MESSIMLITRNIGNIKRNIVSYLLTTDVLPSFTGSDASPYRAKAGCTTSVATLRTRLAPSGMMPALSWS
jgi:hypothetical protein